MKDIKELRKIYAKTLANPNVSLAGWGLTAIPFCVCQVALGEYGFESGIRFTKKGKCLTDQEIHEDAVIVVSKR